MDVRPSAASLWSMLLGSMIYVYDPWIRGPELCTLEICCRILLLALQCAPMELVE
jgi:hypothetical protein